MPDARSKSLKRYWRRFTPAQRSLILTTPAVPPRRRSNLEYVVAKALVRLGIPFEEQVRVGSKLVDFYLPERSTVVEVDGAYYHALWDRAQSEPLQDAALVAAGYTVVRLKEAQLASDPLGAVVRALDPEACDEAS